LTVTQTAANNDSQIPDILSIEANILAIERAILSIVTGLFAPPVVTQTQITTLTLPPSTVTSYVTLSQTTVTVLPSPYPSTPGATTVGVSEIVDGPSYTTVTDNPNNAYCSSTYLFVTSSILLPKTTTDITLNE
jgi:hypothetical protein